MTMMTILLHHHRTANHIDEDDELSKQSCSCCCAVDSIKYAMQVAAHKLHYKGSRTFKLIPA